MATEAQDHPSRPSSPTLYAVSYTLFPIRNMLHILSSVFCFLSSVLTNKPNLVRRRRIANSVCTRNYKKFIPLAGYKNKPNSNPIKPNLRKAKMSVNLYVIEDYRRKDDFAVRKNKPNSKPISEKPKMNINLYILKDYENKPPAPRSESRTSFAGMTIKLGGLIVILEFYVHVPHIGQALFFGKFDTVAL